MNTEELLQNFVPFPREIRNDRLNGRITPSEYDIYCWMRHSADSFGIATVGLETLVADFSHRSWGKNHLNKLLLSLRRKRYLHYESRTGRRGSFRVQFPEFKVPHGGITRLKIVENGGLVRGKPTKEVRAQKEEIPDIPVSSQSFQSEREKINKLVESFSMGKSRGSNNDKETYKEKETNRTYEEDTKEIPVRGFKPKSHEEQVCLEVARNIGEESMNFLLGTHHKHGLNVIETAWSEYCDLSAKKKEQIEDPAKYFNGIVSQILMKRG